MSERYKKVKLYENFKFSPTSPIDIVKGAIYIDNATNKAVFQLKFVNMQEKNIKALYVQIKGSNDLREELENNEYSYLDLNVIKGQEFGTEQLKELNNNTIRNIEITINKVIYTDNAVWENKNTIAYDRINLQKIDNDLLFIARRKATEQRLQFENLYYPFQDEKYWTCICGTFNSNNNDKCYKCDCSRDVIINQYNKNELKKDYANYCDKKQEKKKKKIFTIISIVAVIVLVIIIGVIISNQLKWKDFETCKTDKFTIKYNKNWKITDDLSDFYGKNFEYGNNIIKFYVKKKAELPSTRNTATKLKDETLKQLSSSNMDKLSENSLFDYKVSKLNIDDIKVSGLNGYKIEIEISGVVGLSGALLYVEDDNYIYGMSLDGEDLETFNKMIESIKIK